MDFLFRNSTAAPASFASPTQGLPSVAVHATGTFTGLSATFEMSVDSTNGTDGTWIPCIGLRNDNNFTVGFSGVSSPVGVVSWLPVQGVTWFRTRVTAIASGSVTFSFVFTDTLVPPPTPTVGRADVGSPPSGNPVRVAGRGYNVVPTVVGNSQMVDFWLTTLGAQVVSTHCSPESRLRNSLSLTGIGDVSLFVANASLRNHVTDLQVSNIGVANDLIIKDGGGEIWRLRIPAGGVFSCSFEMPLRNASTNTGINVALSIAGDMRVNAQGHLGN